MPATRSIINIQAELTSYYHAESDNITTDITHSLAYMPSRKPKKQVIISTYLLYKNSVLPISLIFFRYQNFEASLSAQYPLRRLVLKLAPKHFQSSPPPFRECLSIRLALLVQITL